ncbi:MAG: hypothetical protein PGN13_05130 [Patulibacter minatonensis]
MSAEAPTAATVPYVDILREYHRVQGLSTAERVAWKDEVLIEAPEQLAELFARSIAQLDEVVGKSLVNVSLNTRDTRNGPKAPPTPTKARNSKKKAAEKVGPKTDAEKAHEILYAIFEAGGITVSGKPALAADYAGYRISPLRAKDETIFEPGDDVPAGDPSVHFNIDLLLQSRDEDALPIVGLLGYGEEADPILALLEGLAYVALLATTGQWNRLRKQTTVTDEDGESPRFDERDSPQFDIYLIVAGHRRNAASKRAALWEAVPYAIDALLDQPEIAKYVRRIEGIKIPLGTDARVQLAGEAVLGKPVDWDND